MKLFARGRPALVGIDISPEAVRLLQLSRGDAGLQVRHYACEPLPPGAVVDGQVIEIEAVGAAIARARSGSQARYAAVALAAPAAILRLLSVPAGLKEADLEAQFEIEAARVFLNGPLHLDFEVLGPMPDAPDRVQVLLAIAQPAPVNQYVAALKRGGLRTAAVDVDALALARALTVLTAQPLPPEQVIALNRHTANLPEIATSFLAQTIPPEALNHHVPALLIACGLALRGLPS